MDFTPFCKGLHASVVNPMHVMGSSTSTIPHLASSKGRRYNGFFPNAWIALSINVPAIAIKGEHGAVHKTRLGRTGLGSCDTAEKKYESDKNPHMN